MTSYQIISGAGEDMGVYEGESPEAAIEAMHRVAGYESSEAAAEALGTTVEALRAELELTAGVRAYVVDEPGRSPRRVRATSAEQAARAIFGEHVYCRGEADGRIGVWNEHPTGGAPAQIGTVYVLPATGAEDAEG